MPFGTARTAGSTPTHRTLPCYVVCVLCVWRPPPTDVCSSPAPADRSGPRPCATVGLLRATLLLSPGPGGLVALLGAYAVQPLHLPVAMLQVRGRVCWLRQMRVVAAWSRRCVRR